MREAPFFEDGMAVSFFLHSFAIFLVLAIPARHTIIKPNNQNMKPIIVDLTQVEIGKKTELPKIAEPEKAMPPPAPKPPAPKQAEPKPVPAPAPLPPAPNVTPSVPELALDTTAEPVSAPVEETPAVPEEAPVPTPAEPPAPTPQPVDRAKQLDDLLNSIDMTEYKQGVVASDNLSDRIARPMASDRLAVSYVDALRVKLRGCWNIDAGARDLKDMRIPVRTELANDGSVLWVEILDQRNYENSPWYRAAADSARRAILVCSPFANLPPEYFNEWRFITFTFYPGRGLIQ